MAGFYRSCDCSHKCLYAIGSFGREGLTPMKLTLAGAAMSAMFSSFTQGFLVSDEAA